MNKAKLELVTINEDVIATSTCTELVNKGLLSTYSYKNDEIEDSRDTLAYGNITLKGEFQCYVDGVATGDSNGHYIFTIGEWYHYYCDEKVGNEVGPHFIKCTNPDHHADY